VNNDIPDLVNGETGDISLDVLCKDCIHLRQSKEGESCARYTNGVDPITGHRFKGLVFCNWARTEEGPCGRVAFGFEESEKSS